MHAKSEGSSPQCSAEERVRSVRRDMEMLMKKCHDAATMRVYSHRMHVIDNMLTLRCPRKECNAVFMRLV